MTPAEIALMRRIIAWRKANRIEFASGGKVSTGSRSLDWVDTLGRTGAKRRAVSFCLGDPDPLGTCAGRGKSYRWHEAGSFTEAVDILVAKGYLPKRFSSAYRQGMDEALGVVASVQPFKTGVDDNEWREGWNHALRAVGEVVEVHVGEVRR